jgi:hypothetical protein
MHAIEASIRSAHCSGREMSAKKIPVVVTSAVRGSHFCHPRSFVMARIRPALLWLR